MNRVLPTRSHRYPSRSRRYPHRTPRPRSSAAALTDLDAFDKKLTPVVDTHSRSMSSPGSLPPGAARLSRLTFSVKGENHTLGNAVRSILARKVGVSFAGYAVPHPTQNLMNIRVQTTGRPAVDTLRESLADLSEMCDSMLERYEEEENRYCASNPQAHQARAFFPAVEECRESQAHSGSSPE